MHTLSYSTDGLDIHGNRIYCAHHGCHGYPVNGSQYMDALCPLHFLVRVLDDLNYCQREMFAAERAGDVERAANHQRSVDGCMEDLRQLEVLDGRGIAA